MRFNKRSWSFLFGIASLVFLSFQPRLQAQSPLQNRARGYCEAGRLKLAVDNFGRFAGVAQPAGLWGNFQYVSNLSFMLGIPGKDAQGQPYPWALGAKEIFDSNQNAFVTVGDDTTYWGPTVSESWSDFSRTLCKTDWEATGGLNNPDFTAGDFYGSQGRYTVPQDSTPLLATSTITQSWPLSRSKPFWPGHWAVDANDPLGQEEVRGVFVSDEDLYFAFDDRYATRDTRPLQGYPTGVRVEVSCHAFSDSLLRDMIFFDLRLINLSQYDYQKVYAGLYLDADVYSALADGHYYGRSNEDDAVGFDSAHHLAYFYDLDGDSLNPYVAGKRLAYVGLALLKTPPAACDLDLTGDGRPDVLQGEPLGVTGFHWFDWQHLPGLKYETFPQQDARITDAADKERIQYKILAGDTSGLTAYESTHFFHPSAENGNPCFDAPQALLRAYPKGTDAVIILSTGPFDLPAGSEAPLTFCLLMANDLDSLRQKAHYAQKVVETHYALVPSTRQRLAAAMKFKLEQNYPNPFNDRTKIVFTLPEAQRVSLQIFDVLGRRVQTYFNRTLRKGQHSLIINLENRASGIYFYRLTVGSKIVAEKKMLLLH